MISCPNCGASDQTDEETLSGTFGPESQHSWSMQLLVEALEKALGLGRIADADRILRRASALLEERLASGGAVQASQLVQLADAAARICQETREPSWGVWIPTFYVEAGAFPPAEVADRLVTLRLRYAEMQEPIERLLVHCKGLGVPPTREDRDAILRLTRAHRGDEDSLSDKLTAAPPKLN
jgi:hypothetical protein